jgi:hypothetical protein
MGLSSIGRSGKRMADQAGAARSPARRWATISARIESAISSGVIAAMSSPAMEQRRPREFQRWQETHTGTTKAKRG